ncbi:MAG: hypothetical protein IJU25_08805 [Lachnospiraceae bacterium]|nr:hypothetical protein [Lachnospiraceae bacterium]
MDDRMEQMIWERINATIDREQQAAREKAQAQQESYVAEDAVPEPEACETESAMPKAQEEEVPLRDDVIYLGPGPCETEETAKAENAPAFDAQEPDESMYVADPADERDITDKIRNASEEELHELKKWLFGENIRLRGERLELKELRARLEEERRSQEADQRMYLNHIAQERKEVRKEEELVAEKLEIIKRGFADLDADRRELKERERRLEAREAVLETKLKYSYTAENPEVADALFLGVTSYLTLKKRYKDLMKMYHPDSVGGNTDMVFAINRVYDKLLKQYGREREVL